MPVTPSLIMPLIVTLAPFPNVVERPIVSLGAEALKLMTMSLTMNGATLKCLVTVDELCMKTLVLMVRTVMLRVRALRLSSTGVCPWLKSCGRTVGLYCVCCC